MIMSRPRNLVLGTLTAAFVGLSSVAAAQTFYSPTESPNGTVSAFANFSISGGTLTIVLTNTLLNQISSGQAISDLHWTINGGSFTTLPSDTTPLAAGNYININAGGGGSTPAGTNLDSWGLSNTGGTYNLTTLTGGQPAGLIWGNGTASANAGADNFNPYVDQTATFTLAIAGLSDTATISDVVFTFGTNGAVAVPIPAAVWLFVSGLLGLIGIARRKVTAPASSAPALSAA
jgi:hypothetical protein